MADAIPSADPALLAAQAKAGQAGVDAYKAAQNELQKQRQGAVESAMQEAAMRGAPAGAVGSIASTITTPYDQGIAAMTQGSAAFQADMASRDRRMGDYMQAVNAARSYLPQQVEMTVAPMRAQNEFQLRQLELQGRSNVDEINANTQLALARMQAEAAAAARKAAAAGSGLKTGQISGLMSQGAQQMLGNSGSGIKAVLDRSQSEVQGATTDAAGKYRALIEAAKKGGNSSKAYAVAAALMAAAMKKQQREDVVKAVQAAADRRASGPVTNYSSGYSTYVDAHGTPVKSEDVRSALPEILDTSKYQAAIKKMQGLGQTSATLGRQAKQASAAYLGQVLGGMGQSFKQHMTNDPTTGRMMFMTPDQSKELATDDPFGYQILANAPRSITSYANPEMSQQRTQQRLAQGWEPSSYQNVVEGAPDVFNKGAPDPYSSTVLRDAMVQSGAAVGATDPEIADALPNKGQSIYDFVAAQGGGPSSQDVYQGWQAEGAVPGKAQDKMTADSDEATAAQWLDENGYSANPPTSVGDVVDAYNLANDPQSGPAVDQAIQRLQQILDSWSKVDKSGNPVNPTRNELKEMLRKSNVTQPKIQDFALWKLFG